MKCKRCNFDNEDDAQKCINCGMKLEPRKDNTKKEEFQKPTVTVEIQSANTQNKNNDIKKMQMRKSENDYFQSQYRGPGSNTNNSSNFNENSKIKAANNNIQKRDENPRAVNDYYLTEYKGPQDQQQKVPKKGKKLWITVVLAILFVGFGHIYLKEYKKALIFIIIAIVTSVKIAFFTVIGVFNTMYQLLDAINTYKSNYIS